jgi:hypothetical protein
MTAERAKKTEPAKKHERHWSVPKTLFGRARTSTVVLCVAFVVTAMLYSYLNPEESGAADSRPAAPVPSETQSPSPAREQPSTSSSKPTTTGATSTSATPTSAPQESVTSTPPPIAVLPPWLPVPSGVELPPGVVTATPETPTTPPTPTP